MLNSRLWPMLIGIITTRSSFTRYETINTQINIYNMAVFLKNAIKLVISAYMSNVVITMTTYRYKCVNNKIIEVLPLLAYTLLGSQLTLVTISVSISKSMGSFRA